MTLRRKRKEAKIKIVTILGSWYESAALFGMIVLPFNAALCGGKTVRLDLRRCRSSAQSLRDDKSVEVCHSKSNIGSVAV